MIDSPLKFEKRYQKLKSDCSSLKAADLKLLLLIDFWPILKEYQNRSAYQSYFDEYLPGVTELITEKNLSDLSIEELHKLYNTILNVVGDKNVGRNPASGFDSSDVKIKTIATALAKKLFYVGEAEKALNVLKFVGQEPAEAGDPDDLAVGRNPASGFDFSDIDSLTEFEILQSIYEKSRHENPELSELLQPILIEWQNELESVAPDIINCLFVEKNNLGHGLRGRMRRLEAKNIETFGKNAKNDEITFEEIKVAPKDPFTGVAYNACDAVRKVFRAERIPTLAESYYHAHFSIQNGKHTFTGDSIGLAFGLLTYTKLQPETSRYEKFISSAAAFTGGIDKDGRLIPVNSETLSHKIDRAFFSPMKYLIIPEANIAEAERILKEKWQSHPRRKLRLIPAETLREVIDDSNVIKSDKVCMLPYITRIVYKYSRAAKIQIPILLALIYLVVCLIFPKAWIGFDWNPQYVKLTKNGFEVLNKDSISIWHKEYECDSITAKSKFRVGDINNDGKNEVAFCPKATTFWKNNVNLFFYGHDGRKLFQRKCSIYGKYRGDSSLFIQYKPFEIDFIKTEDRNLIISKVGLDYPARTHIKIWSSSGDSLGWYITRGFSSNNIVRCFAGSENECFLLKGINNDMDRCGSICVLNLDSSYGVSPPYENLKNVIRGNQKHYIIFPRSDVNIELGLDYNPIDQIVNESANRIKVDVYASYNPKSVISYFFNKDLHVIDVKADDRFIPIRENLIKEGRIQQIDLNKYLINLRGSVLYWSDSDWVSEGQFRAAGQNK